MKLTNITKSSSKLSQQLRLPLRKKGGLHFTVVLNPGESIFLEERNNNNVVRIYEKKKFLSITNENPVDSQVYYVVYTEAALNNAKEDIPVVKVTKKVKVEVQKENLSTAEDVREVSLETELEEVLSNEMSMGEEIEVEILVPEDSIVKTKGGRPKGSKNKSKRGRPKSKKSVGRPSKKNKSK